MAPLHLIESPVRAAQESALMSYVEEKQYHGAWFAVLGDAFSLVAGFEGAVRCEQELVSWTVSMIRCESFLAARRDSVMYHRYCIRVVTLLWKWAFNSAITGIEVR